MAQATVSRMKKGARRFARQTRAFVRLLAREIKTRRARLGLVLTGLMTSLVNHPSLRRSRVRREGLRLWRRFVLLMSDGYNFDEFYRTQHGVARTMDQLPTTTLLAKAYELSDDAEGVAAMRILVERAVLKAQVRLKAERAVAAFEPKPHDPAIPRQWRDAVQERDVIEEAFVPRSAPRPAPRSARVVTRDELPIFALERRGRVSSVIAPPEWGRSLPFVVDNDDAFELSVPELVPYRAITRH